MVWKAEVHPSARDSKAVQETVPPAVQDSAPSLDSVSWENKQEETVIWNLW